jgi:hypothetical protein
MTITVEKEFKVDLLDTSPPALSATSDMPVIETKPDAEQPKTEAKPESKPAPEEAKAEVAKVAAPDEGKKPEESAPTEQPEDDPAANAEPPKAKGVQKRIDELVRQREEEKAEKLRLLALVEQYQKPKQELEAKPDDEDPAPQRPTREAFADPTGYEQALADYADAKADWSARHAVQEALAAEAKKTEQRQIEDGQRLTREAYAKRVEKAVEEYPDYKAVAESPDVMVSIPMAHAILHSEHGPKIAYHLGKNPEEAKRISTLSPPVQLIEMGLLVARLTMPSAPAAKEAPAPQKPAVSAAPKPLKPLESKSDPVSKAPQDMSMDEYAEHVKRRDAPKRAGART